MTDSHNWKEIEKPMHTAHSWARGLFVSCLSLVSITGQAQAEESYPPLEILLQSGTTVIDQPIFYPEGAPEITVAIVTMQPQERTAWHHHDAPLVFHILEGEITIDYGPDGTRTFREGDTNIEAFRSRHQGVNTGTGVVRILAFFVGAEGTANTVLE